MFKLIEIIAMVLAVMFIIIIGLSFLDTMIFGTNWFSCVVTGFCVGQIN